MAEIAHPYQETAAADERAATQRRPRRVSFSELVEAWAFRESGTASEDRFQELRDSFVRDHGEITGFDYSDDGTRIVVGELSGVVVELDADTFEVLSPPVDTGLRFAGIISAGDERMAIAFPDLNSGDPGWYAVVDLVAGK